MLLGSLVPTLDATRRPAVAGYCRPSPFALARGLKSLWLINEGGGGTIRDICQGTALAKSGSPTWATSFDGRGVQSPSVNDYFVSAGTYQPPFGSTATLFWRGYFTGTPNSYTHCFGHRVGGLTGTAFSINVQVGPRLGFEWNGTFGWLSGPIIPLNTLVTLGVAVAGANVSAYIVSSAGLLTGSTTCTSGPPGAGYTAVGADTYSGNNGYVPGYSFMAGAFNRVLTTDEWYRLHWQPGLLAAPPPKGRLWFSVGSSDFTATGGLTAAPATLSASATFTAPTYHGSAALSAAPATAAASATFAPGTKTAAAALNAAPATAVIAATFAPGTKTAAAALTAPPVTTAIAATFSPGTKTAAAALAIGHVTTAIAAAFTAPQYAGTASLSIAPATLAGIASFGSVIYLASAGLTAPPATAVASGTFTPPSYHGSAALTVAPAAAAASATFTAPSYTGTAALAVGHASLAALATFATPVYTASGSLTVGHATAAASATFESMFTGTAALTIGHATAAASATLTVPVYTATGSMTIGAAVLAGRVPAGMFTAARVFNLVGCNFSPHRLSGAQTVAYSMAGSQTELHDL